MSSIEIEQRAVMNWHLHHGSCAHNALSEWCTAHAVAIGYYGSTKRWGPVTFLAHKSTHQCAFTHPFNADNIPVHEEKQQERVYFEKIEVCFVSCQFLKELKTVNPFSVAFGWPLDNFVANDTSSRTQCLFFCRYLFDNFRILPNTQHERVCTVLSHACTCASGWT